MRKPSCRKLDCSNKEAWSKQEDQKLMDYINTSCEVLWSSVPQATGLVRCGNCCRLRWIHYLRPDQKRDDFEEDEVDLIIRLHALLGNRWSLIAGRLPGRSAVEVKNYWRSHIRKKLLAVGIGPHHRKLQLGYCNHNSDGRPTHSSGMITAPTSDVSMYRPHKGPVEEEVSDAGSNVEGSTPMSRDVTVTSNSHRDQGLEMQEDENKKSTILLLFV